MKTMLSLLILVAAGILPVGCKESFTGTVQ
jgi:hypothetical protein